MPTIQYAPNPVASTVTLDEADIAKLRACIIEDWTEDGVAPTAEFVAEWVDLLTGMLQCEHMGDCTCCPFTCEKCRAEGYLGIDTMPGLYKHDATHVQGAFGDGRNIHEAIEWLANHDAHLDATPDDKKYTGTAQHIAIWDSAVPRWKEEAKRAHAWLTKWRDEHFAAETAV